MALFSTPVPASLSLRVLARLLSYPDAQLRGDLDDMRQALLSEKAIAPARLEELDALISGLARGNALENEAEYVEVFDRGRATSLHLFEHVHGDSRDRGPAMIDLAQTYEKAGLFLGPDEMPDYLPVVLEFVSTQPPKEARAFLGEMAHIFNAIFNALQQRNSPYASVLGALLELSGEKAHPVKIVADEPLDTSWEEPVVFDGCSVKGQTKPDQAQPIHFVKTDAAKPRQSAAATAGAPL
ncbi:nitrate reductase molybdenum cofactor assembly chaperone [Rhodoferax sp.]|jgi:nitrate reductase delta subunit|uniref:nitrate reductase molybdenum cofactor assembly chaperone n=1 Tax=Rhodoferax sp. TaxID=50421 RepID=UPI00271D2A19|nr:nitrate reductase molybdenum cofactor assembly chaperone [Rhodoferax sp.]MDO9144037.1 nitrate reductase molybdenum cofactor assembly chaperone [Rhodoferax sp.]MDP1529199.1 nitrate reductase molybdenum cofactor assembly chaperone [Rhodoferax sp.]MDP1943974.1 nitrate reductase molybdenum cofactor assembly chaperone [Rhodoferax sp.]MDP2441667.1 nitrate reductase molybdenum cofactor assembly chaperone [Rhodoferax sp.]MDP3190575.1 nitrate reductase molybdenum cofactor assembly chaperone [Rhodofe